MCEVSRLERLILYWPGGRSNDWYTVDEPTEVITKLIPPCMSRCVHGASSLCDGPSDRKGLRTYIGASPANAQRFADLYARLPAVRRVLEPAIVNDLQGATAAP